MKSVEPGLCKNTSGQAGAGCPVHQDPVTETANTARPGEEAGADRRVGAQAGRI